MRISFFRSLPVRLAGLILILSGVTLLVLTEINRRAVERILSEQAEIQAMQATLGIVDGLDAVLGSTERLARSVARDLGSRALTAEDVTRVASNLMLDQTNLYGFSIAFEPGVVEAATERFGVYVHRSRVAERFVTQDLTTSDQAYWNSEWYREALDKGLPVWSEPFFDRGGSEQNVVRIAAPIVRTSDGRRVPIGVVSAIIELDWLRRLANTGEFAETSFTIVFSREGRLILHPNPNYVIAETVETLAEKENVPELATMRQKVIARRQGALSYFEPIFKRRVHVNYKPTKVAGWGVLIGYDEAEFLKPQRAFRKIAAAYLGATLLLLAGIVIGVTRRALRPLGALATSADEIAKRNLDCAIPEVVREDEVGNLTRSFRAMRDALKAQHAERRWASQSLEHQLKYNNLIIDSIGELVFVITKGLNIARINSAVTRVAGYTLKDVLKSPIGRIVQLAANDGAVTEVIGAAVKNGESLFAQPVSVRAKDGTQIPARLTLVPLQDGGQVVGAVATLRTESNVQRQIT